MKRPWEITFLGVLFIAVGVVLGIVHAWRAPLDRWLLLIELVEVWAVVSGVFLIMGRSWARWAAVIWLAFHIWVGALHSFSMGLSHAVLAIAVAYFLLRSPASLYFRQSLPPPAKSA